uniref:Uncharacterized protein n=1 Tax=Solanum tuberosum TaxID=4113 RepID=M1DTS9_SOLTU
MGGLVTTDHLASLVRIADQLGDLPFGVVHCCLAPAFSIIVLWVIGRHGTALRNFRRCADCSLFRRLDPILQGSAHMNKRRSKTLRRLAKWTR